MSLILNIETSTKVCSAALHENGKPITFRESFDANSHSEVLLPFIEEVLAEAEVSKTRLDGIGVSKGPGSYTGLRIGVSSVKGLAYALDLPVYAIDSLSIIHAMAREHIPRKALVCPMIDARRMEVYCAMFDAQGVMISDIEAKIIEEGAFENYLNENIVYFTGNGAAKCRDVIRHDNARFLDGMYPSAKYMGAMIQKKSDRKLSENTAYFEPFYLKQFVTNKPKKNLLL